MNTERMLILAAVYVAAVVLLAWALVRHNNPHDE